MTTRGELRWTRVTGRVHALSLPAVTCVILLAGVPRPAEACSCGQAPLPAHARSADVVFVGTVADIDVPEAPMTRSTDAAGKVWFSAGWPPGPATVTFHVGLALKGETGDTIQLPGNSASCGVTFAVGETWIVYARRHGDRLLADACSRTRPIGRAIQDLVYFDGLALGRQEGVAYGVVVLRGRDRAGQPALFPTPPDAGYVVVARVEGGRRAVHVDSSAFDLVLPVGDATVWVERAGRPVSSTTSVKVTDGGEHRLTLIVDEPEG